MGETVYKIGYTNSDETTNPEIAERLSQRWGFRITAETRGDDV